MSSLNYLLYDVFTDQPFCGNPLAVFLHADGLSSNLMSKIADELNLSETVFISQVKNGSRFKLRIFTPLAELPFAGHPTIGAAMALRDSKIVSGPLTFDMAAGEVPVTFEGIRARFTGPLRASRIEIAHDIASSGQLLGIDPTEILQINGSDAGVPFACIEVASRAALRNCILSLEAWHHGWDKSSTPHIYVYFKRGSQEIDARMFAPAMGISEDPATGGAAAALAAILPNGTYMITQGEDLGRPSSIELQIAEQQPVIGGAAVRIGEGNFAEKILGKIEKSGSHGQPS